MTRYFIEAADVLFFKDGREIAPGSEYSAASIFPPNPGTLYGALRSAMIALENESDFRKSDFGLDGTDTGKLVGSKTNMGSLIIQSYALAKKGKNRIEPLYVLPQDVLVRKKPDYDKGEKDEALISKLYDGSD